MTSYVIFTGGHGYTHDPNDPKKQFLKGLMNPLLIVNYNLIIIKGNEVDYYNVVGFVKTLPSLKQARTHHACGHFVDSKGRMVSETFGVSRSRVNF